MIRAVFATFQQAIVALSSISNNVPATATAAAALELEISAAHHSLRSQQAFDVKLTKPSGHKHEQKQKKSVLPKEYRPKIALSATTTYNASSLNADFFDVSMSGSGQYVATVTNDAVLVSSNNGKTFTSATTPVSYFTMGYIAIASSAPQYIMFVGGIDEFYVSTNYGTSFTTAVFTPPSYLWYGVVAISGSGQYAYVANDYSSSLYFSSNYLSSFQLSSSPGGLFISIAISTDGSTVYALTNYDLYQHATSSSIWSSLSPGATYFSAVATNNNGQYVAVLDGYGYTLYVSNNYGAVGSWSINTPFNYNYMDSILMSSSGQYLYSYESNGGIYYSSNYGVSFTQTQAPPVDYSAFAMNTAGNTVVAVSTEGSIYQTTNSGSKWTPNHYNWVDVAMSHDGITTFALASSSRHGFGSMSTNGGVTWLQTGYNDYVYNSVVCGATCQNMIISNAESYYIYLTIDYGKNWIISSVGYDYFNTIKCIAISSNGKYVSAGMWGGYIYISTNYGIDWVASTSLMLYWKGLAMSYSGQNQIAVGSTNFYSTSGSIYLSTDYGMSWTQITGISTTNTWTSVASDSTGKNLVATTDATVVYFSNNYGSTWSSYSIISSAWVSSAVSSTGLNMYVVSSTGVVYASFNSGSTWAKLSNVPVWNYKAIACDSTGQYLTLVAYSGPVLKSSDSGTTWYAQNIVFSTTNDFGEFYYSWNWGSLSGLAMGIIIALGVGSCVCCCCVIALIAVCFCGACRAGVKIVG